MRFASAATLLIDLCVLASLRGVPSEAASVMEMGADAVLVNTALAEARDPARMADAFRLAVVAGREAFLAGRMPIRAQASPSSPVAGVVRLPQPEVPA